MSLYTYIQNTKILYYSGKWSFRIKGAVFHLVKKTFILFFPYLDTFFKMSMNSVEGLGSYGIPKVFIIY
jgi:hypothetical protein